GGRRFIMRAAGSMNVMVARVPTMVDKLDPPLEVEVFSVRFACGYADLPRQHLILRPPRVSDVILARRERDGLAVVPIDLIVKEEIRGQSAGPRWIDAAALVADRELGGRRHAVVVK